MKKQKASLTICHFPNYYEAKFITDKKQYSVKDSTPLKAVEKLKKVYENRNQHNNH